MAELLPVGEEAFERLARASQRRTIPKAVSARYDMRSRRVVVRLGNGIDVHFDPRLAHGLEEALVEDLRSVSVTGAGSALHFAKLDEGFTVSRLLEGFFGPLDWAKQEARAEASRCNGRLGGCPKKTAA